MKETATLKADERNERGSSACMRLRKKGLMPAVLYGHKEGNIPITIDEAELMSLLASGAKVFTIDVGGNSQQAIIKEIQYSNMGDKVVHVDFNRIKAGETMTLNIAIEVVGTAKGTKGEGILEQPLKEIEVECLPSNIPDNFVVNVTELDLGEDIRVKDLEIPEGVKTEEDPETVIVQVVEPEEEEEIEEEEEGKFDMPEVIGEQEEESSEEGESEE